MDFGPHTIHIFVSLVVVLAAAGVALVCDLLKGNNEHLRELAVELKVRHEEAERRAQVMEKRGKRIPDLSSLKPVTAVSPTPAVAPSAPMPKPAMAPAAEPVEVPMPQVAAAAASVAAEAPSRGNNRPERRRREMSPAVAAVAQAAAAIVNGNKEQQQHAFASASAANESGREAASASADGRRKNWDSILRKTVAPRQQGALIPFESIREAVPAGFHDASVLQRSVESGRTVSGLVVSIGTNGLSADSAAEVGQFLKSMLSGLDFACQSGSDEFILICSGEQGAAAQRRLSAIAEKLWDFQLSSIGGLGVQFSWGSCEARGERIGEAVATAIEQMQDTRHSRRSNIAKAV